MEVAESWADKLVVLGDNVAPTSAGGRCTAWSPVFCRPARLHPREFALLESLSEAQRISEVLPEVIQAEIALGNSATHDEASLRAYLRLQSYLAQGVLVEEVALGPDDIGSLLTTECSDGWRTPHAVRIRDLRRGDPRREAGAGVECAELGERRETPFSVQICRRRDEELVLLDNARLACDAFECGARLRARLLAPADYLARCARLPREFFGTMRDGIPYQSIYVNGEIVICGRRPDLHQRLDKVRPEDLRGKAVLDLSCNIGMNCFLAVERGARLAVGIDLGPLTRAAARLNGFYNLACRFLAHDLNDEVTDIGEYDTVFVFALIGHLDRVEGLLRTIRHVAPKTVYVETHCTIQPQGDLDGILQSSMFRSVEFLGHCRDNVARSEQSRRLYRCEVAP